MTSEHHPVRVRFAPSPTGPFHVGSARTVLYNWLFARQLGGSFLLRIEDTDQTRYSPEAEKDCLEGICWLGLDWDEGPEVGGPHSPYVQSQRTDIYRRYAQTLLEGGHAYRCFCTPERLEDMRREQRLRKQAPGYDRFCRNLSPEELDAKEEAGLVSVLRLKVPREGVTVVQDRIRGDIRFENSLLEDVILLKSDGFPTYHLANVVDDFLMGISHIMRGDEWVPSTPLHVMMYAAFGWQPPVFAHLPVILSPSGKGKMSKRKLTGPDGQELHVMLRDFRQAGYLPEAMVNHLARVGWAYDDHTELFTLDELIAKFSLEAVNKSPAAFSYDKLLWLNGVYIRKLDPEELARRCLPFLQEAGLVPEPCTPDVWPQVKRVTCLVQERLHTLRDVVESTSYFFIREIAYPEPAWLIAKKQDAAATRNGLERSRESLAALPTFDAEALETALRALAQDLGWKAGQLFMPIRVAVTGRKVSPGLFQTLVAVGRDRCLERLGWAIAELDRLVEENG
jgi:glutamyl-tRNA synthetase